MKPHFTEWYRIEMLSLAAESWIGTPFVPFAAIRGAGVDCVNLCAEVLKSACFNVEKNSWPKYVMAGGTHNQESQLIGWLRTQSQFHSIWHREANAGAYTAALAMPGDVLCFRRGRSAHHAGVLIAGSKFVHANFITKRVTISTLNDPSFKPRLTAVYRPMEAG